MSDVMSSMARGVAKNGVVQLHAGGCSCTSEPLAYKAVDLWRDKIVPFGKTELFRLIKNGELESFTVGRARYVTRQSLLDFMERQITEQKGANSAA
jgi:hypothetical protein